MSIVTPGSCRKGRSLWEVVDSQLLVESLKRYEDRLDLRTPDRKEWTFLNSFNYAYGLILTLGHGAKIPETTGGQDRLQKRNKVINQGG
ncbi:hypothetical protein ANCCEY_12589 [Ancylostoma ceylanicum]|uniref:Uncharacterized protein n=1 Tax=Ancylostoma ceylanicum TaxID=53326 RepID=A0A0D6LL11_9BILA|nr:hypothetical protein ANCCEY_12589 [Ancylostoma ceylanicum]